MRHESKGGSSGPGAEPGERVSCFISRYSHMLRLQALTLKLFRDKGAGESGETAKAELPSVLVVTQLWPEALSGF